MRNSFLTGIFGLILGLTISMAFTQAAQPTGQMQTPQVQTLGQAEGSGQMQAVAGEDAPGQIRHAIDNLNEAKGHLMGAGGEWGGHKAKAINSIDGALKELNLGVDWAHAHGTY
jgi:hypothetical protein